MSIISSVLDSLKKVFETNPQKVVMVAMNEKHQIITLGSGQIATSDALVMLASAIANVYLEMTPDQQAQYPLEVLNDNVKTIVLNRVKEVAEARMLHLQQQMNQVNHLNAAPQQTAVVETEYSTVEPVPVVPEEAPKPTKRKTRGTAK